MKWQRHHSYRIYICVIYEIGLVYSGIRASGRPVGNYRERKPGREEGKRWICFTLDGEERRNWGLYYITWNLAKGTHGHVLLSCLYSCCLLCYWCRLFKRLSSSLSNRNWRSNGLYLCLYVLCLRWWNYNRLLVCCYGWWFDLGYSLCISICA